eukprot:3222057-Rhodomonas_salina.2
MMTVIWGWEVRESGGKGGGRKGPSDVVAEGCFCVAWQRALQALHALLQASHLPHHAPAHFTTALLFPQHIRTLPHSPILHTKRL